MFTGLVDHIGQVIATRDINQGLELTLATRFTDIIIGESIAINGTCVTVTETDGKAFTAELSPETLQKTHCGELDCGDAVNLERALCVGARLGGHWVSGHVDCTARVSVIEALDDFTRLRIDDITAHDKIYCVPKGSITVDGVSLTLNRVFNNGFEVMLIPKTLELTTLGQKKINSPVNIEFDSVCKTVVHAIKHMQLAPTPEETL